MTLPELAKHVVSLGVMNGEITSWHQAERWFRLCFTDNHKYVVFELALPDGNWCCLASSDGTPAGYEYTLPDTREQESDIWRRIQAGLLKERV